MYMYGIILYLRLVCYFIEFLICINDAYSVYEYIGCVYVYECVTVELHRVLLYKICFE